MMDITWNLTRHDVVRLWQEAYEIALDELLEQEAQTRILSCHLMLYNGRRSEFYSPIGFGGADQNRRPPDRVLLLIDDIYDMFWRLTRENQLFEHGWWTAQRLQQYWEEGGNEGPASWNEELKGQLTLQSNLQILSDLLEWRHSESILAEVIAREYSSPFLVLGVKQSTEAVAQWLEARQPRSTYLSHPISRPRRQFRKSGTWPDVVAEFNELQPKLIEQGTICVMPTAIDEYRIDRTPIEPMAVLIERLSARWPLPLTQAELLYEPPVGTDAPEFLEVLSLGIDQREASEGSPQPSYDLLLRGLENQIKSEVPFRDHLLVAWNLDLLVFRPLYQSGAFSDGVGAEIKHWWTAVLSGEDRRAVFIHFHDDLEALAETLGIIGGLKMGNRETVFPALASNIAVSLNQAGVDPAHAWEPMVTPSLLDKGELNKLQENDRRLRMKAIEDAANKYLRNSLTQTGGEKHESVLIVFAEDSDDLRNQYAAISLFLRTGRRPLGDAEENIWSLLGVSPVDWVQALASG